MFACMIYVCILPLKNTAMCKQELEFFVHFCLIAFTLPSYFSKHIKHNLVIKYLITFCNLFVSMHNSVKQKALFTFTFYR